MNSHISHDRREETPEAKARWFQSLSLEERMDYLSEITDLILENNPQIIQAKGVTYAHTPPSRVRVLERP